MVVGSVGRDVAEDGEAWAPFGVQCGIWLSIGPNRVHGNTILDLKFILILDMS